MTDEISRILEEHPELYSNRQQFVESAIREEIRRIRQMEPGGKRRNPGEPLYPEHPHRGLIRIIDEERRSLAEIFLPEPTHENIKQALSQPEIRRIIDEKGVYVVLRRQKTAGEVKKLLERNTPTTIF